jgi:hypothetical protein
MSRGAGKIEQRIAELFAATRDRGLGIDEIARAAFWLGSEPATRAQRLSATRAAHRVVRRTRETHEKALECFAKARANAHATVGREVNDGHEEWRQWRDVMDADPLCGEGEKLNAFACRVGIWVRSVSRGNARSWAREFDYWCVTALDSRRIYFHPPDAPVRVWAVSIQPAGVIWSEAEVVRITERNVMVRYAGDLARLDRRQLWHWWAWWRGVMFASSRTGRIATHLDEIWHERYGRAAGGVPPAMQMPLAEAMALLGVSSDYTEEEVTAAFRRAVKKAHPDAGGTAEQFRKLVAARDRLLKALGCVSSDLIRQS